MLKYAIVTAAVIFAGSIAAASAKPDKTFLADAIQINLAEISVGDLAQKNGGSDDVKSFGKMLVDDHTASNSKATSIAQANGITPKRCEDSEEKLPPSISKLVETVSPVAGQTKTRTPISHLPELKTSLSNVLGWSGKNLGSDSSVSRLRPAPFSVFEILQTSTLTRCVRLGINRRFGKVTRVPGGASVPRNSEAPLTP
jgi:hypothetical protein